MKPLPSKVRAFLAGFDHAWTMKPCLSKEVVFEHGDDPATLGGVATLVLTLSDADMVTKWIALDEIPSEPRKAGVGIYQEMYKAVASAPDIQQPSRDPSGAEAFSPELTKRLGEEVTIEVGGEPVTRTNEEWIAEWARLEVENQGLEGDRP